MQFKHRIYKRRKFAWLLLAFVSFLGANTDDGESHRAPGQNRKSDKTHNKFILIKALHILRSLNTVQAGDLLLIVFYFSSQQSE